jgi:transposase-like protein
MTQQHLVYKAGEAQPDDTSNHRNGKGSKTVLTDSGEVTIEVPRGRQRTFEPQLIGKHERRFTGFDDKIVAIYARGMLDVTQVLARAVIHVSV